jgi:hypothetical protein
MEWPIILVIVLAAPIILLPVAFVWYLNIAGVASVYKGHEEEVAEEEKAEAASEKSSVKVKVTN